MTSSRVVSWFLQRIHGHVTGIQLRINSLFLQQIQQLSVFHQILSPDKLQILTFSQRDGFIHLPRVFPLFHEAENGNEVVHDVNDESEHRNEDSENEDIPQDDHDVMVKDVLRVLANELMAVDDRVALIASSLLNLERKEVLS